MFKVKQKFTLIVFFLLLAQFLSCTKDKAKEPETSCGMQNVSFTNDIEPILENSCNLSGCHNAGSFNGDYTTYSGVKEKVDNGSFKNRVLDLKDMPAPPVDPLNEEQLEKISCWLEDGAPNN